MRMWRGCAYLKLWISWQWKTQYIFNNCVQSRYIRKRGLLSASTRDCLEGLVAARCGAAHYRPAPFRRSNSLKRVRHHRERLRRKR